VVKVCDTGTSWCTRLGHSRHCEKSPGGKVPEVPHCYVPRALPALKKKLMKDGIDWRMNTVTPSHDGVSCSKVIKV